MSEPNRYVVEAYHHALPRWGLSATTSEPISEPGEYLGRFRHFVWAYSVRDAIDQVQLRKLSDDHTRHVYSVSAFRSSPHQDDEGLFAVGMAPLFLGKDPR